MTHASRAGMLDGVDLLVAFWSGYAVAILILQLWHFRLPVDARATGAELRSGFVIDSFGTAR